MYPVRLPDVCLPGCVGEVGVHTLSTIYGSQVGESPLLCVRESLDVVLGRGRWVLPLVVREVTSGGKGLRKGGENHRGPSWRGV